MPKLIRIIHCSDLHFDSLKPTDCLIVVDAFIKDIEALVKEGLSFDLFLFTGDLVKCGNDEDSFKVAREKFLDPSIASAKLNDSRLFVVSGNHDVQLAQLNEYFEDGISSRLISREEINKFLDEYPKKSHTLVQQRFAHFNKYILSDDGDTENELFRTKVIEFPFGKVGIAMLNSSWHATGKGRDFDHGKLIIGERQVEKAALALKECDFNLAMFHHPLDWLSPTDKTNVIRSLHQHFELVLFGHAHYSDPISTVGLSGRFVQAQAGCLYHARDYFNGYSIITADFDRKIIQVDMREYYDERRMFDKSLRFAEEGKIEFPLHGDHGAMQLILSVEAETAFHESINGRLISAVAAAGAPKNIRELFVVPVIQTSSIEGGEESQNSAETISIDEIIKGNDNVIFYGRKESGKSTLINYLAVEALPGGRYFKGWLPLCIQYSDIGHSVFTVLEAIRKSSGSAIEIKQIRSALHAKKVLLLVDDLDVDDTERTIIFRQFLSEYTGNRIIGTSYFDPIRRPIDCKNTLGFDAVSLHLSYFKRKQVKELIARWLRKSPTDVRELTEQIISTVERINAPVSPFLVSVLLWMQESEISFEPVNQAVLIQTFVRGLLGRLGGAGKRSDLDERNFEHFLGHLSEFFTKEWRHSATRLELEGVAVEYFKSRYDLKFLHLSVADVLNELIRRGVLIEINGGIGFKYRCFFEYFAAQRMTDSKEFFEDVIQPTNMLRFAREIDTYTALKRDDETLLTQLTKLTEECFAQILPQFNLAGFDELPAPFSAKPDLSIIEIQKGLEESRLDDESRERVLDGTIKPTNLGDDQCPTAIDRNNEHYAPGELLDLLSRVLRNSELIKTNDDAKLAITTQIFRYWGVLLAELMVKAVKARDKGELPSELSKLGAQLPLIVIPQLTLIICHEAIGSAKLGGILFSVQSDINNPRIVRILSALVYFELRLEKRFDVVRNLLPLVKDKPFLASIAFIKLRMAYMLGDFSKTEESLLLEVLADLLMSMRSLSTTMHSRELAHARSQLQVDLKSQKGGARTMEAK